MRTSFENQIKQKTSMKGFMASLKRRSLVISIVLMFLYTWAFDLSTSAAGSKF